MCFLGLVGHVLDFAQRASRRGDSINQTAQTETLIGTAWPLLHDDAPSGPIAARAPRVLLALSSEQAEIRGVVTDAQGKPRPKALVELRDASGALRSTQADASGSSSSPPSRPEPIDCRRASKGSRQSGGYRGRRRWRQQSVTLGTETAPAETRVGEILVVSQRYDPARNALSPSQETANSSSTSRDIVNLPRGVYRP
jgi:hypothetical protein